MHILEDMSNLSLQFIEHYLQIRPILVTGDTTVNHKAVSLQTQPSHGDRHDDMSVQYGVPRREVLPRGVKASRSGDI